ncbi:glycosyltransferase family 4 protein [Yunchengibacter salinarum]|uniref:glycosyltransferase family 4 protein n=1 Tax=Yunchengibacter salinarum TaxID=3133399 RepID=UPI0035B5CB34
MTGLNILLVSDAWTPQVNGVVRTLQTLRRHLQARGHRVTIIAPRLFHTVACPTYPEIRLAVGARPLMRRLMNRRRVDAVHIATEGPLGWAARAICTQRGWPFTTAYHTAFPDYIAARTGLPAGWFHPLFRRFHAAGSGMLVATPSVRAALRARGYSNIRSWTRGVDTACFHPGPRTGLNPFLPEEAQRPIQLYVGRVAVEKNLEAFLKSTVPGTRVVVGDGPARARLEATYPDTVFTGALFGAELAAAYRAADVFVFPSRTDTFGLVMIEALACGTPVAAYPVQGPLDVLGADGTGPFAHWHQPVAALNDDLDTAITQALEHDRAACADFARLYDWDRVADQFLNAITPIAPWGRANGGAASDAALSTRAEGGLDR